MQNTQETDLGTDVFGVGSNLEERLCTGLEEQLEKYLLVMPDERVERVRNAEYQVIVVDRQQLLLASGQPFITGIRLAFGAMAISARNGEIFITCIMESISFWGVRPSSS